MTTSRSVLLISAIALILLALVPAVSANQIIYDEDLYEPINTTISGVQGYDPLGDYAYDEINEIYFKDITKAKNLNYLVYEIDGDHGWWLNDTKIKDGRYDITYQFSDVYPYRPGVLYLNRKTDALGQVTSTQFTIFLNEWDIGDLTGEQRIRMSFYFCKGTLEAGSLRTDTNTYLANKDHGDDIFFPASTVKVTESTIVDWKHHIRVEEGSTSYFITINGYIDGYQYNSRINFWKDGELWGAINNQGEEINRAFVKGFIDHVEIVSPSGASYVYPLFGGVTPVDPTLRTGSVIMTDLNGNKISGFEVTAVNAYTGESYTVSTETDTAFITLPMDRTVTIPNPQTGEPEEAPVGYYYIFGNKPGYKMVYDDGIRVTVLPEKYTSYQLCNIVVTEVSGNLRTGTVTMTDHNGTTISGFEVKAVNYYTGEEYTVSTESDVATITLPMDQTTTRRHIETGEYAEVPVGYYLFYGYKPGYKMLNEDGIRVSVLPVEYQGSYQLCDIIVTPEDGYLTGRHKFQLRSVADNSILQTGTISAQSATTGEWYNATVVNGMATLILPYDASSPYYEYVGNYFVYGSSPGYLDTQEGVRVSVTPDRQDEIWGIYLTPIGGVPEPGNVTLRIHAISETGQGIPNAEIFIKGVDGPGWELWETYTASSTGYAEISVPENSTYDITVSATGYISSSRRIEVTTEDPPFMQFTLYLSGWVTPEPTTQPTAQPTGWPPTQPPTQPPGGVPGDDGSEGFLSEAIRGISKIFGVGFATGKTILGMLLALAIGFTTAKKLRGGAAEFGLGLLGGTMLGVLIGLLPVWTVVVLLLIVGMYIGYRYVGGSSNG